MNVDVLDISEACDQFRNSLVALWISMCLYWLVPKACFSESHAKVFEIPKLHNKTTWAIFPRPSSVILGLSLPASEQEAHVRHVRERNRRLGLQTALGRLEPCRDIGFFVDLVLVIEQG